MRSVKTEAYFSSVLFIIKYQAVHDVSVIYWLSTTLLQPPPLFHHESQLFSTAFETQILAAVSNHVAMFPLESEPHDPNYPPQTGRSQHAQQHGDKTANKRNIYKTWAMSKTHSRTLVKRKHTKNYSGSLHGRSSSFCMFDFAHQGGASTNVTLKAADLPLNAETLQSIATICFPGQYVYVITCLLYHTLYHQTWPDTSIYTNNCVILTQLLCLRQTSLKQNFSLITSEGPYKPAHYNYFSISSLKCWK